MSTLEKSRDALGLVTLKCPHCEQMVHNCYFGSTGFRFPSHHGKDLKVTCGGSGTSTTVITTEETQRRQSRGVQESVPEPAKLSVAPVVLNPRADEKIADASSNVVSSLKLPKKEIAVWVFDESNGRYVGRVVSPAEYVQLFDEERLIFQQRHFTRPVHLPTREEALAWSKKQPK